MGRAAGTTCTNSDRGVPVYPATIYPAVPAARPSLAPATPSGVVPEARHVIPRDAAARNVPVPAANPSAGVTPVPTAPGAK